MGFEIERKFLLKDDTWRGLDSGRLCRQGYLSTRQESAVRVRIIEKTAFLTIKGAHSSQGTLEFEYPIPLPDAEAMLRDLARRPLVEKVRYRIPHRGLIWEVDEFSGENAGLLLAEVELERPDQLFAKPEWAGDEVTGDPRYYNVNLVDNPYTRW